MIGSINPASYRAGLPDFSQSSSRTSAALKPHFRLILLSYSHNDTGGKQ